MGEIDEKGILQYSDRVGRCTLKNVTVKNQGIDYSKENIFWKPTIYRLESCRIFLEGNSEFEAQDLCLEGNFDINVEDGYKVTAKQSGQWVIFMKEKIKIPSWRWDYQFDDKKALHINKVC
jgi:hypothetical protein